MRKFFRIVWLVITSPFRLLIWIGKQIGKFFKGIIDGFKVFFMEDPEESPLTEIIQVGVENPMTIFEHINDLRKHLFRAVIGFVLMTALAFVFVGDILDWITVPVGGIDNLQAIEVTESVGVVMRVALMAGFAGSLPYIVFELMLFAAPGLSRRARIIGVLSIPLVTIFFVGGLLFAFYLMVPPAIDVLLNFMEIQTLPRPASYVKFVTGLMFWIGVAFEFPLVAYVLSAMRILKPSLLRKNWRIAVIAISVLAAFITPTVDPVNMSIVMIPLIALYGLGTVMAYLGNPRSRDKEGEEEVEV